MAEKIKKTETKSAPEAVTINKDEGQVAPVAAPKKSNTVLIVVIILIVLLGLPAIGFGAFWYFVGRKIDDAAERLNNGEINLSLGEDASINTTKNQNWPTNLPLKIPELTAGEIASSGNLNDIWSIMIEGASRNDILDYQKALVRDGWTAAEPIEAEGMGSYSASKDDYGINIILTTDEDGTTTTLVTLGRNIETVTE